MEKKRFGNYATINAGSIHTDIYRLKAVPVTHSKDIFNRGDDINEISGADWEYLKRQIVSQKQIVAARNAITKGLIDRINDGKGRKRSLNSEDILDLTLTSLHDYLSVAYENHKIQVSYWRAFGKKGQERLKMVAHRYPKGIAPSKIGRIVSVEDTRWKVCQVFREKAPIAVSSVATERRSGKWHDFCGLQRKRKRGLESAFQIPIYFRSGDVKNMQGVLCVDANLPDTFLVEEVDLWRDDLVGFLVNISLSERMRIFGG